MTVPRISVIIVSWNVAASLRRCLSSVIATGYKNLEIFVIDNHSSDNSVHVAESFANHPIQILANSVNVGFPKAVNQGLAKSTGDFCLLLNPDAALPRDFFTKALSFFVDYPNAAVVGPKLVDPDGHPQGSVFPEPSILSTFREFWLGKSGLTAKYVPDAGLPVVVNAISGACMFFPRRTLDLVGKLTEQVFMYYEDLDFCRRIRKHGLQVYFNPRIVVTHEHGQSSAQTSGLALKYLQASSKWYNGAPKHYLMWFISLTGQKFFT